MNPIGLYGQCRDFPPTTRGRVLLDVTTDLKVNPNPNGTDMEYSSFPTPVAKVALDTSIDAN